MPEELAQRGDTKVLASIKKQVEKHHMEKERIQQQPGSAALERTDEHGNVIRPKVRI